MRALQLATHGHIPTCPLGVVTQGMLACGEVVIPEIPKKGGGGGSPKRKFSDKTKKVDWITDDYVEETAGGTVVVDSDRGQTQVTLPTKRTVRFAPPIDTRNDGDADRIGWDSDYRSLVQELRRKAIQDHQIRVLAALEQERLEEEELLVFLMLLEDET